MTYEREQTDALGMRRVERRVCGLVSGRRARQPIRSAFAAQSYFAPHETAILKTFAVLTNSGQAFGCRLESSLHLDRMALDAIGRYGVFGLSNVVVDFVFCCKTSLF